MAPLEERVYRLRYVEAWSMVVPWKYGFKSAKSIVTIHLTEKQPVTIWMQAGPNDYGFYYNVNPDAEHARWSQSKERRIGEFFRRKTLLFNGYADSQLPLTHPGRSPHIISLMILFHARYFTFKMTFKCSFRWQ